MTDESEQAGSGESTGAGGGQQADAGSAAGAGSRVEGDGGVARPDRAVGRDAGLPSDGGTGATPGADVDPAAMPATEGSIFRPTGRSLLVYVGGVVGVFVAAGIGLGLGSNFILGFLIEQFVEPGANPTDSTLVSIMLLHNVVTPFLVGPLMAVGAGALIGRALPERRLTATAIGGSASLVGFYLMTGLTLFLTINVVAQYSTGGAGGGGGLDQAALGKQVIESGIPAAVVGGLGAYIGSYVSG
jgi:hypothetical protein